MHIVDGNSIVHQLKKEIATDVAYLQDNHDLTPHVAVLAVGDPLSLKDELSPREHLLHEVGFIYSTYNLPFNTTQREAIDVLKFLNVDEEVDAIVLHFPIPPTFNKSEFIDAISIGKDVECYHSENIIASLESTQAYQPALIFALLQIIKRSKIDLKDKQCVFVEKNNQKNSGTKNWLLSIGASIHSVLLDDKDMLSQLAKADIAFIDIDKANFIKGEMLKQNAIVFDLGMHKLLSSGEVNLVGDVLIDQSLQRCHSLISMEQAILPIASLSFIFNTLLAKRRQLN